MTKLQITGEVEAPQELSFDDLRALPGQVDDVATLVPGREGGAVKLATLLNSATPREGATHATLSSTDGRFSASVELDQLSDALVVYRMDDEPLPRGKGGPLRFLIPNPSECHSGGADACANVKFLGAIELSAGPGMDTRDTKPPHPAKG